MLDKRKFKQRLLDELYEPFKNCKACPLSQGRTQIVFGQGNPNAQILFIGEAPGRDEDLQGLPFVGRSGQLLTKVLEANGISRESVYITNIVKCRPPNNRLPTTLETTTCKNIFLYKQVKIIRPKIICTLGSCALNSLLDNTDFEMKITKVRGQIIKKNGLTVIPTFHPAYILRNQKQLETFAQDIAMLKEIANK